MDKDVDRAMRADEAMSWWNERTRQYDAVVGTPTNDQLRDFLPQQPAARLTFEARLALGMPPLEAYLAVLDVILGPAGPPVAVPVDPARKGEG